MLFGRFNMGICGASGGGIGGAILFLVLLPGNGGDWGGGKGLFFGLDGATALLLSVSAVNVDAEMESLIMGFGFDIVALYTGGGEAGGGKKGLCFPEAALPEGFGGSERRTTIDIFA